jgi:hypothetical protein
MLFTFCLKGQENDKKSIIAKFGLPENAYNIVLLLIWTC